MPVPLAVKIFPNPANASYNAETQIDDWTGDVEDLQFSTSAFGGFQNCTFTLKRGFDRLYALLEGKRNGLPTYITNRLRIEEVPQTGQVIPWEGLIATMELYYGQQVKSRSYLNMYNTVRVQHLKPNGKRAVYTVRDDYGQKNKFGTRCYILDTDLRAAKDSALPNAIGDRFLNQHKRPNRSVGTEIGGVRREVGCRVTCLGMADTLSWRYAFNKRKSASQDTGEIVKDLLRATSADGWREPGVGSYGQQFITENFNSITATNVSIPPVEVQGRPRLDIIAELLRYGNSSGKRMLFQVFQGTANSGGKGQARFLAQSNEVPFTTSGSVNPNYNGYFFSSVNNWVMNQNMERIPPWRVRGGNWLTDVDSQLKPPRDAVDIFDDPRALWIEEANYNVERDILKIVTADQAQTEFYLGRLIHGTAIVTETI